ncbi:hypothetical protein [Streptomyces thermoalcalitolerans]|uniref:Uncharacterized protein n=1 Tax=Streptomyces thermoalcalitolerans TaxID=65605 RepID=A0ABN1NE04_9ACTN
METSILIIGMSGKLPERWAAILDLAVSEIPLVTQQLDCATGDWLKKARARPLPHPSRLVKGKWPLRVSTGSPRGDRALSALLYRRIADILSTLPRTMTAVHLSKCHIHQTPDHLLDLCAKLLGRRPSALVVLVTSQGVQWHQLTPAGPDPQQLTPDSIPCTESEIESLLTLARLAAYECHRRRSSLPGMTFFRI